MRGPTGAASAGQSLLYFRTREMILHCRGITHRFAQNRPVAGDDGHSHVEQRGVAARQIGQLRSRIAARKCRRGQLRDQRRFIGQLLVETGKVGLANEQGHVERQANHDNQRHQAIGDSNAPANLMKHDLSNQQVLSAE